MAQYGVATNADMLGYPGVHPSGTALPGTILARGYSGVRAIGLLACWATAVMTPRQSGEVYVPGIFCLC
jgi:hypothetical protein